MIFVVFTFDSFILIDNVLWLYPAPITLCFLSSFPYELFIFSSSSNVYTNEEIDTPSSHGQH